MMKNKIKKVLTTITFTTFMTSALCACQITIPTSDKENEYTAIGNGTASTEVENLEIEWVAGKLTVVYDDVDEIYFEESAAKELEPDAQMRFQEENGTLSIAFCKSKKVNDVPRKNLTMTLPKNYEWENVHLTLVSTDVMLPAGFVADSLNVENVSGNIETAGGVSLEDVEINTVSGNIVLEVNNLESFQLESVSGNAQLMIPSDAEFEVGMDSISGHFSSDFDIEIDGKNYSHGSGKTEIQANTVSGDLEIFMQK